MAQRSPRWGRRSYRGHGSVGWFGDPRGLVRATPMRSISTRGVSRRELVGLGSAVAAMGLDATRSYAAADTLAAAFPQEADYVAIAAGSGIGIVNTATGNTDYSTA